MDTTSSRFYGFSLALLVGFAACQDRAVQVARSNEALTPLSPGVTAKVGRTQGQLETTPSGAAHYRVEIDVPPGRRGVEPNLAFDYLSERGDGVMGVGFSLSGLSVIRRCRRTYAQDDEVAAIAMDETDRFCLGGNRLVAVSGHYGEDGTIYRLERETFSKIVGHAKGGQQLGFTVYKADTTIASYGALTSCSATETASDCDSVSVARGGTPAAWGLKREADRFGNYFEVTYEKRTSSFAAIEGDEPDETVEHLPIRLDYTGHSPTGTLPNRRVDFHYIERSSPTVGYRAGSRVEQTRLLSEVLTHAPQVGLVKSYRLEYETAIGSGKPILTALRECGGDNICKPATQLTWQQPDAELGTSKQAGFNVFDGWDLGNKGFRQFKGPFVVDIDNDGRDDLVFSGRPPSATPDQEEVRWYTAKSTTGLSPFADPIQTPFSAFFTDDTGKFRAKDVEISDVNDDGRMDLYQPTTGDVILAGGAPGEPTLATTTQVAGLKKALLADVDGDGLADSIDCKNGEDFVWQVHLHRGDHFAAPIEVSTPGQKCTLLGVLLIDADGDGSTEILAQLPTQVLVPSPTKGGNLKLISFFGALPTVSDSQIPTPQTYSDDGVHFSLSALKPVTLDVNGDGLKDVLVGVPGLSRRLWLSTGQGFVGGADGLRAFASSVGEFDGVRVVDFNRDGRQDLLVAERDGSSVFGPGTWAVYLSTGVTHELTNGGQFAFEKGPSLLNYPKSISPLLARFADFNGDTLPDFLFVDDDRKPHVRLQKGQPLRLSEIREGSVGANAGSKEWLERFTFKLNYVPVHTVYDSQLPIGFASPRCEYPVTCRVPKKMVVGNHWIANRGGILAFSHEYYESRSDRLGRGWLGFGAHKSIEHVLGGASPPIERTTRLDNHTVVELEGHRRIYPYRGRPLLRSESVTDGPTVHTEKRFVTHNHRLSDGRIHAYPAVIEDLRFEGSTETRSRRQSIDSIDEFGNPTQTRTRLGTADAQTNTLVSEYDNDPDDWIIGLRTRRTVRSERGGISLERHFATDFDHTTGAVIREIVEPDDPERRVVVETRARDSFGNPVVRADLPAEGGVRVTTTQYDADGVFAVELINPAGHVVEMLQYPGTGEPWTEIGPNGASTLVQRDGLGRITRIKSDGTGDTTIDRRHVEDGETFELEIERSTNGGSSAKLRLDWTGTPVQAIEKAPFNKSTVVDLRFNARGRVVSATRPRFVGVPSTSSDEWEYDGLGRVIEHKSISGAMTTFSHIGLETHVLDPNGNETRIIRNDQGQLSRVIDAKGGDTRYTYRPFSIPYEVLPDVQNSGTGSNLHIRRVTDAYGRLLILHDPSSDFQQFEYDSLGQKIRHVDGNGDEATYEYDVLGRLVSQVDTDGETSFEWDAQFSSNPYHRIGRLRKATSPDGVVKEFNYRSSGEVTYEATQLDDAGLFWTRTDYDGFGRSIRKRVSWPTGKSRKEVRIDRDFGEHGDLLGIDVEGIGRVWQLKAQSAEGRIVHENFGNGLSGYRSYTDAGRLAATWIKGKAGTIGDLRFAYDAKGNLTERRDQLVGKWQTFEHDALDRVTATTNCGKNQRSTCNPGVSIDYDSVGNIVHKSDVGSYSSSGHAVQTAGAASYGYDGNGNQTNRPGAVVSYNALDRAETVNNGSGVSHLTYDAFGMRVRRKTLAGWQNTDTTIQIGDFEQVSALKRATVQRVYVKANGTTVAVVSADPKGRTVRYLHQDHLGSPAIVSNVNGVAQARLYFDSFGQVRSGSWSGPKTRVSLHGMSEGFTGHSHDDVLDWINMVGRDYDPTLARFLTPDPIISHPGYSQSLNRFSYVWNNPLRLVDPSGFVSEDSANTTTVSEFSDYDPLESSGPVGVIYDFSDYPADENETVVTASRSEDGGGESDVDVTDVVGALPIPFVETFMSFDANTESLANSVLEGDNIGALGFGTLAVVDAVTAVVEGLSLGTATLATRAARSGIRGAVKTAIKAAKTRAKKLRKKPSKKTIDPGCFVAGTAVTTSEGIKPIEDIQLGDRVLSRDPETKAMGYREVVWLKPPKPMDVVELNFENKAGQTELIVATPDHPFWVRDRGWQAAQDIELGAEVSTASGSWLRLTSGTWGINQQVVYNFEVEGWHTYFVGELEAWVHNTNDCGKKPRMRAKDRRAAEKRKAAENGPEDPDIPGNNDAQNKMFNDATRGLTERQKAHLHDELHRQGNLDYKGIKALADELRGK